MKMPKIPSPCAASASAGSSPALLLLTSMLLRGVVLTLLLLRLSDTLSAGWAAVEDGASLAVRNCRSQSGCHTQGLLQQGRREVLGGATSKAHPNLQSRVQHRVWVALRSFLLLHVHSAFRCVFQKVIVLQGSCSHRDCNHEQASAVLLMRSVIDVIRRL